jgi:outer membrane receptor protein involved in Fe transport
MLSLPRHLHLIYKKFGLLAATLSLALLSVSATQIGISQAQAQQLAVEEIVVTARKRSESLQEIPLSITAFTNEQLRAKGIDDVYDLASSIPNFSIDKGFGRQFNRPVIRGQSQIIGRNASFFVDGVFVSNSISAATIDSLERIEVVRGPQAALFGRATFSGAINYITKQPSNEYEGQWNGRVGSHDDYKVSGWLSGPIVEDKLQFFVGANWDYYGGEWNNQLQNGVPNPLFVINPFVQLPMYTEAPTRGDSSRLGDEETQDITAKLRFTPSETVEINLKGTYIKQDDGHPPWFLIGADERNCYLPVPGTATARSPGWVCGEIEVRDAVGDLRPIELNIPDFVDGTVGAFGGGQFAPVKPGVRNETYRFLSEVSFDIGDWELQARGAYNTEAEATILDNDYSGVRGVIPNAPVGGFLQAHIEDDYEDYSFEARLTSPQEGPLRGLAGFYYYDEEYENRTRTASSTGPTAFAANGSDITTSIVENWAAFGLLEYDVTDDLTLTLEGRYAEDTIGVIPELAFANRAQESTFDSFAPRLTVDYQVNDDILLYALVAKGTKPGGFNDALFSDSEDTFLGAIQNGVLDFEEERSWNYEAGAKTTFNDGRGLFNLTGYYIDWSNQQLTQVVETTDASGSPNTLSILVNVGEVSVKGIEMESSYAVNDNITLSLAYGLADTQIERYNDDEYFLMTGEDDPNGDGNVAGNQLPKAPKHTLNMSGTYRTALSADADWFITADLNYKSKLYTQVSNFSHTGDRWLLGARLGVDAGDWKLTLYGENLLNDLTPSNVLRFRDFTQGAALCTNQSAATDARGSSNNCRGFMVNYPRGRDFGITAQYNF